MFILLQKGAAFHRSCCRSLRHLLLQFRKMEFVLLLSLYPFFLEGLQTIIGLPQDLLQFPDQGQAGICGSTLVFKGLLASKGSLLIKSSCPLPIQQRWPVSPGSGSGGVWLQLNSGRPHLQKPRKPQAAMRRYFSGARWCSYFG